MKFKRSIIILVYQEYDRANHKDLWNIMAEDKNNFVCVMNISADQVVSRIKHKEYRIREAKESPRKIHENMFVGRALLLLREEISPEFMHPYLARTLWNYLYKHFQHLENEPVEVIVYNALWAKILFGSREQLKIGYFLTDEVRYHAHDNSIRKKAYALDEFACKYSNVVYTMSKKLEESRSNLNDNVHFIGNGADLHMPDNAGGISKITNSIAFIGNIRDWIDKKELEDLIRLRPDLNFFFVGTVEENMKEYLSHLLSKYMNTFFHYRINKQDMGKIYRKFNVVIIPYVKNEFIQSSRPIKIVESIICGTPVVTVPVNGYQQNEYIRFATSAESFSLEIDYLLHLGDITKVEGYQDFCNGNSWQYIAKKMLNLL